MNAIQILNQLYEIQHKIESNQEPASFERNFTRLYSLLKEDGFFMHNPTNEIYLESRTDCEASIVGQPSSKMKITKTIKPIIYQTIDDKVQMVQKAVVLVEKI